MQVRNTIKIKTALEVHISTLPDFSQEPSSFALSRPLTGCDLHVPSQSFYRPASLYSTHAVDQVADYHMVPYPMIPEV